MPRFSIYESDQYLSDVEEAAVWILESNLNEGVEFAVSKVDKFEQELENLKSRLSQFPESGEADEIKGLRKFPIYSGRYSLKWVVDKNAIHLTLIALTDSRYPKKLRNIQIEDF